MQETQDSREPLRQHPNNWIGLSARFTGLADGPQIQRRFADEPILYLKPGTYCFGASRLGL
jgi:hypothetical protein